MGADSLPAFPSLIGRLRRLELERAEFGRWQGPMVSRASQPTAWSRR
jgi:hypothetical protein